MSCIYSLIFAAWIFSKCFVSSSHSVATVLLLSTPESLESVAAKSFNQVVTMDGKQSLADLQNILLKAAAKLFYKFVTMNGKTQFSDLNDDCIQHIVQTLPRTDLKAFSMVSKRCRTLSQDRVLEAVRIKNIETFMTSALDLLWQQKNVAPYIR
jgi:hypothetical protein